VDSVQILKLCSNPKIDYAPLKAIKAFESFPIAAAQACTRNLIQDQGTMAIAYAVQRGTLIQVYDERGQTLFTRGVGSGPNNGLKGYTNTTVTIQAGNVIQTIDDRGRTLFVTSTR
jgi:hypothetical protein